MPPLRAARAALFAAVSVCLALVGHLGAGGARPAGWTVLVGVCAVWALAMAGGGRERTLPVIVAAVTAIQLVMHQVFTVGALASGSAPAPGSAASGSVAAALFFCHPEGVAPSAAQQAAAAALLAPATGASPPAPPPYSPVAMLLAHLLAAVVLAWWLRRGEAALWRLARRLRRRLHRLVSLAAGWWPLPEEPVASWPNLAPRGWPRPPLHQLRHVLVQRAPPRPFAVAAP